MEPKQPQAAKGKQSRQQRRCSKTRKKVLDAARSVFAEKGLGAATVDEIAERADIGHGSFYYHFDRKDELISHLIENMISELVELIEAECAGQTDLEPMLDAMINAHIKYFSKRWEDFVLYYQGRADLTLYESYEGLETPFLNYIGSIEKLIDCTISEPIPKPRLRRLACAFAGFISGYYSFASVSSTSEDVDKEFMSLRKAFVASLARFIREALPENQSKQSEVKLRTNTL